MLYLFSILTRSILLVTIGLLICLRSWAQIEVINWDTLTHAPTKSLPFDRPFTLRVPLHSADVQMVNFIERIRFVTFNKSINKTLSINNKKNPGNPFQKVDEKNWEVKEVDKKPVLLIHFRDNQVLKPSRLYNILILGNADKQIIGLFDQFNVFQTAPAATRSAERIKTVQINDTLSNKYKKEVGVDAVYYEFFLDSKVPIDDAKNSFSLLNAYNTHGLGQLYTKWKSDTTSLRNTINRLTLHSSLSRNSGLKAMSEIPSNPSPEINDIYLEKYFMGGSPIQKWLAILRSIDGLTYKNLVGGFQDINCDGCKLAADRDYAVRKRNVDTTLKAARELLQIAEQMKARNTGTYTTAYNDLNIFVSDLQKGQTELKDIISSRKAIDKAITDGGYLSIASQWTDSYINSFSTRSKYSVVPDFGLVVPMRLNPSVHPRSPYLFVPYFGFHVNFRYVDKDLPYWSYRKTPWHFFSAFVGWSLVSVAQGPKSKNFSAKDSTQNFFEKSTLLTGLGFRLGNAVRLTGGTMWYFQQSGVAIVPEQYKRRLKAWPFLGISLDLELNSIISTFAGILSGSPTRAQPIIESPAN
ncbi:hypothetical protein GCM10027299_39630 [Larkinella ripae]